MDRAVAAWRPDTPIIPLDHVSAMAWRDLANRTIEPNAYILHDWAQAVSASARGRTGAFALTANHNDKELIGLLPVVSLWRARWLPLPALVTADPYGALGTPLVDREHAAEAWTTLLSKARQSGACAVLLRDVAIEGATMNSLRRTLSGQGLTPQILQQHARACLDATRDAEELLHEALGSKKLKELRRQRNRLSDFGKVTFDVATTPEQIAAALPTFLELEGGGWKGSRGTALNKHSGDVAFIRRAAPGLAATRQCEIATLRAGESAVAAGIILRHFDRAFFFKLGVDERFARNSVGVQLTIELTRHFCNDPFINMVDSTAAPGHPMIDPIWRGRLTVGDVLIPLHSNDPWIAIVRMGLAAEGQLRRMLRRSLNIVRQVKEKIA